MKFWCLKNFKRISLHTYIKLILPLEVFLHWLLCLFKSYLSATWPDPAPSRRTDHVSSLKQSQQASKAGMTTKPEKWHHQRIKNTDSLVFWQIKVKMTVWKVLDHYTYPKPKPEAKTVLHEITALWQSLNTRFCSKLLKWTNSLYLHNSHINNGLTSQVKKKLRQREVK